MAARVERRYGGRIAQMFGVDQGSVRFQLSSDIANPAWTSGNTISINPQYAWRGKGDVRGALIHELTHAYGVGAGTNKVETYADLARYRLNHGDPGWEPSKAVLRMAGTDGNGPRAGVDPYSRRNSNTTRHDASKASGKPGLPVLGPEFAAAQAQQLAGIQQQLLSTLAALKSQKGAARAQFTLDKAGAKAQRIDDMASTVNAALDRGVLGSSFDLSARAGVVADEAAAINAARMQKATTLEQLRLAAISAQNQAGIDTAGVAAQGAAQQAALAIQQYQAGAYDRQMRGYQDLYRQILERLQARRGGRRYGYPGMTATGNGGPNGTVGTILPGGWQSGGGF